MFILVRDQFNLKGLWCLKRITKYSQTQSANKQKDIGVY